MPVPDAWKRAWRGLVAVGPHGDAHWVAARAGLSLALPPLTLWALDRLDLALPAVFGAFASLYGRTHSHRSRTAMQATAAAVMVTAIGIGTVVGTSEHRAWWSVAAVTGIAALATFVSRACAWHPPGGLFAVFAVGATAAQPSAWSDLGPALGVAAGTALLALLIGRLGPLHGPHRTAAWSVQLRAAARSRRTWQEVALATAAVGLAGVVATAAGLGHGYWASVGAAAAVSGPTTGARVVRAVQRSVGTIGGVLVAALLLGLEPSPLATIALAIGLQVAAELLIGRNYALALLTVTPLALLMVHLGSPVPPSRLIADRVVDTLVGTATGVVVVLSVAAAARRRGGAR